MKTKQPLGPSDVPPGSVMRMKIALDREGWCAVETVLGNKVTISTSEGFRNATYEELEKDWEILRPGQDWQPCYKEVDQFNPADYKPGQEVDFRTARKLHAAGVKLEWRYESVPGKFYPVENPIWTSGLVFRVSMPPGELTADEANKALTEWKAIQRKGCVDGKWYDTDYTHNGISYRLKPAPITRDIRPDELPERFLDHDTKSNCIVFRTRSQASAGYIALSVANGDKWSQHVDGPWNPFTVTEEPK